MGKPVIIERIDADWWQRARVSARVAEHGNRDLFTANRLLRIPPAEAAPILRQELRQLLLTANAGDPHRATRSIDLDERRRADRRPQRRKLVFGVGLFERHLRLVGLRHRDLAGTVNLPRAQLVHGHRGRATATADKRNAAQFEHALDGAIFSEWSVQHRERDLNAGDVEQEVDGGTGAHRRMHRFRVHAVRSNGRLLSAPRVGHSERSTIDAPLAIAHQQHGPNTPPTAV